SRGVSGRSGRWPRRFTYSGLRRPLDLLRWRRQLHYFPLRRLKLRRIPLCVRRNSAQFFYLFVHALKPVVRVRVVAEKLRWVLASRLLLQFLKKLGHTPRVVT